MIPEVHSLASSTITMDEKLFYIPIVGKDTLCTIICDVNPDEVDNSTAKSFFHWQTLKCRFIVNLMQDDVIGSPVPGTDRSFYIITTKDFYHDGGLTAMFERLNLTASAPQEVTSRIYISCIRYTFQFILAPKWNRVSNQLYIKGRHFLTNNETNAAIKMNLKFVSNLESTNDEISVTLLPFNVILYPIKLRELGLPQSIVVDFVNNPAGIINVTQFKAVRVTVLPSMRKGRLLSIYKQIPDTCPFKNWTELRRHWKNMYGYRLPEADDGFIFYEIYFPVVGSNSGNHFVYPEICVKEELNQLPYKNDPAAIANKFMNDLIGIMPKMLSRELQVNEKSLKTCVTKSVQEVPFTPIIQPFTNKDSQQSDRLSLSTNDNNNLDESRRQPTTSMSPTPSLLGKRNNTTKSSFDFENLKKIKKIHESKPMASYQSSISDKSEQHSSIKNCGVLFGNSMTSTFSKVPGSKTSINIFSPSAASTNNPNSQYKTSIPMTFTRPVANREDLLRFWQIKK